MEYSLLFLFLREETAFGILLISKNPQSITAVTNQKSPFYFDEQLAAAQ